MNFKTVTMFGMIIMSLNFLMAEKAKPNVVFFLVDDFGWGALSSMGSNFHETPNIDNLAKSGVAFSDGYAACTVCSPSRAAILTGRYPGRTHLTDWIPGHKRPYAKLSVPDWNMKMEHEGILFPEALKEAGYATSFIGKWHLLPINEKEKMKDHYPEFHGFDQNIGGREWGQPKGRGIYFHPFDMPNMTSKEGDYLTDRLTDYAVDFIEKHQKDPFLLYFSYYTVHGPLQAKPDLVEKYKKKWQSGKYKHKNPVYAAMVQSLDESVGRVLDKLDELGIADNTIVIFTGDNGAVGTNYCGGLKGAKALSHEGGVREPFFIKGPGIEPGVSSVPVMATDFYPTILDLAGLPLKLEEHQDGVSLKPLLMQSGHLKERSLFWHYPHYHKTKPYGAIRKGDFKLIEFFEDGSLELYDLKNDQSEKKNLAEKMPEKATELLKDLKAWRLSVDAQMPTANPNYDPAKEKKK
ncbi:putative secreted sulfatase ydeN precursor [Lentisphaera araneosa HTCC2155]|uniref:Putative secreted sulfatase ydeN n=1 Tax=Lentisphaera araneosa HTCC2155 TaxID=313628 RepID=A6DJ86_9BACT|nr:sulfatase [Lentisphaera araneosa]EDM28522.1 putative secreted sulfatase ydeN precursor [Lentisphaera araneosa HTCC2155]